MLDGCIKHDKKLELKNQKWAFNDRMIISSKIALQYLLIEKLLLNIFWSKKACAFLPTEFPPTVYETYIFMFVY